MVKLYHRYSQLDRKHEFCIECEGGYEDVWKQWVWFYLGKKLAFPKTKYNLFPFVTFKDESKLIKTSTHLEAEKAANTIAGAIKQFKARRR